MGILCILLTIGPTFVADIAVNGILPHIAVNTYYANHFSDLPVYVSLYSSGSLTPLTIVVFVPLYLFLLRPFIHDYIPGMLKRMGLGMILLFISGLCTLAMTSTGHNCPRTYDVNPYNFSLTDDSSSLLNSCFKVSLHFLILQNSLNAVGYTLLYIASYEFICAQSPHAMKGLVIGTYFAIKGVFQLLGVLAIYTPIGLSCKLQGNFPVCSFIYYLINIVIALSGIIAFMFVAKKYQYRQRDEPDNIYRYVEEYYAKAQDEPNSDSDDYDNLNVETIRD